MLKLIDIKKDCQVQGIDPAGAVRIISADKTGENAITVIYKDNQGRLGERMLFRTDEPSLSFADKGISWGFDAPGGAFKLGVEALRIHLAHLFDPITYISRLLKIFFEYSHQI